MSTKINKEQLSPRKEKPRIEVFTPRKRSPNRLADPRSLAEKHADLVSERPRCLTPLPEIRQSRSCNNLDSIGEEADIPKLIEFYREESFKKTDKPALRDGEVFRETVDIAGYETDDLQVVVTADKVSVTSKDNPDDSKKSGLQKVVLLPDVVDPVTVTWKKKGDTLVIKATTRICPRREVKDNGMLSVPEDDPSKARITLQVPTGYNPEELQLRTVSKHYLVINSKERDGECLASFELPDAPDIPRMTHRVVGGGTVIIEVPFLFRARCLTC